MDALFVGHLQKRKIIGYVNVNLQWLSGAPYLEYIPNNQALHTTAGKYLKSQPARHRIKKHVERGPLINSLQVDEKEPDKLPEVHDFKIPEQ